LKAVKGAAISCGTTRPNSVDVVSHAKPDANVSLCSLMDSLDRLFLQEMAIRMMMSCAG
jgi:hypothetical protein